MPFELIEDSFENTVAPLVVIIDDEFTSRAILDKIVQSVQVNITIRAFSDPITALAWVRDNQPDLIIVDYMMKGMTGLEAVKQMRGIYSLEGIPIVVVTAIEDQNIKYQALESGATDFIAKPIDPYECRVRCRNMLHLRLQQKIILNRAQFLEQQIADATRQIRHREQETLFRLAKAGEYRDQDTGNHIVRMARYSRLIGEALGLAQEQCDLIELAAPMHDIGKIATPDSVLLKPGKLDLDEWDIMKLHPGIGHSILDGSQRPILRAAATIAHQHHEKYDGSGYPQGLKGEEIHPFARIVAVADVFDALIQKRCYKPAWPLEEVLIHLKEVCGTHLDPTYVDILVKNVDKALAINEFYPG